MHLNILCDIKSQNKILFRTIHSKKVLLCERKRHTARRIASTRYAALSNPDLVGGGTQGTPHHPDLVWGVPHPDLVRGVPPTIQTWLGGTLSTPTIQTWDGVTPPLHLDLGQGTPRPETGVPPYLDLRWGTPCTQT